MPSQTSLYAFWNPLVPRTNMQERVYSAISELNSIGEEPTNLEISKYMKTKEHKITGRVNELEKRGDIYCNGYRELDGYNRKCWKITQIERDGFKWVITR